MRRSLKGCLLYTSSHKFLRIEPKVNCVNDAHTQAMLAATMSAEDVAVVFSYSDVYKRQERAAGWGVEFYRTEDGQYRRFRSGGHTFPRSLRCASGRGSDTYGVLYRRASACGITMLKDTLITELLRSGERVVGAAGMDEQGRPLVIAAKTVILACLLYTSRCV